MALFKKKEDKQKKAGVIDKVMQGGDVPEDLPKEVSQNKINVQELISKLKFNVVQVYAIKKELEHIQSQANLKSYTLRGEIEEISKILISTGNFTDNQVEEIISSAMSEFEQSLD